MKKILVVLAVVLFGLVSVQAAGLTAPTIYGPSYWECVYGANASASEDTLADLDTLIFAGLKKKSLDAGYEYAVSVKVTIGSADSIRYELLSYGSDGSTLMNTTGIDTVSASTTDKIFVLPIGKTVLSNVITLKAIGLIDSKYRTFYRTELWRRALAQAKTILQ
jgi:hypothetical protein